MILLTCVSVGAILLILMAGGYASTCPMCNCKLSNCECMY